MALVLGLITDASLRTRLERAAPAAGFGVRVLEHEANLEGAELVKRVAEWQPALVIVELSASHPWDTWIAALKTSPATRRIPIVGFSTDAPTRARATGYDVVLAQDDWLNDLPGLLTQHARRLDETALETECQQPLSPLAQAGLALHNRGEFFEAHEALEHAWNNDSSSARELYRGLLQISVAYLQIERGNYSGALKMFLRMRQWLDPLPDLCRGVNVAQARADALAARAALETLGPERLAEFDRALFKPIRVMGDE